MFVEPPDDLAAAVVGDLACSGRSAFFDVQPESKATARMMTAIPKTCNAAGANNGRVFIRKSLVALTNLNARNTLGLPDTLEVRDTSTGR